MSLSNPFCLGFLTYWGLTQLMSSNTKSNTLMTKIYVTSMCDGMCGKHHTYLNKVKNIIILFVSANYPFYLGRVSIGLYLDCYTGKSAKA